MKIGRNLAALIVVGMASIAMVGCSDSPSGNSDQATVTMRAEMTQSAVGRTFLKDEAATILSGVRADSLMVTRVRILVSELKLHRDKEDTVAGDKTVKVGPIMIQVDSTGTKTFTTATVPPGTYDKLKFEFHRLSSSEVGQYLNDTVFADFVTNERSTVVIEGRVYNGGTATPFEYKSDMTANLSLKLEPAVTLNAGSNTTLVVVVDPVAIFRSGSDVLDPRDPGNENTIDNVIKDAIKALKK